MSLFDLSHKYRKKIFILIAFSMIFINLLLSRNIHYSTIISENENDFYVITTYFNPVRYASRYSLYKKFETHMAKFSVKLITVELVFKNQTFEVTKTNNPDHIQLRTDIILWYKENLINIALKKLPKNCKYVAWVDGDIEFMNENWVEQARKALSEYNMVQLFQYSNFLGPKGNLLQKDAGFGYYYATDKPYRASWSSFRSYYENGTRRITPDSNDTVCFWHPGFAWASKRSTLINMGGFIEVGILGGGDFMMSYAYINRTDGGLPLYNNTPFTDVVYRWSDQIQTFIKQKVGYINGDINHYWHGSFENRQYQARDRILHGGDILFNPKIHLSHDQNTNLLKLSYDYAKYLENKTEEFYKDRKEDEK